MAHREFPLPEDGGIYHSPGYVLYRLGKPFYQRLKPPHLCISFPKSGRTWVRTFLAAYCARYFGVPFMLRLEAPPFTARVQILRTFPRIVFRHTASERTSDVSIEERVVRFVEKNRQVGYTTFLVRDPRDTVLSFYYHQTQRKVASCVSEKDISTFLRDEDHGMPFLIRYLNAWAGQCERMPEFVFFRYEDLRTDPQTEFERMLQRFGIPLNEQYLAEAIAFSSFDNMRRLEEGGTLQDAMLQATDLTNLGSRKVRKGKVGAYREELAPSDIAYCDEMVTHLDPVYGYR